MRKTEETRCTTLQEWHCSTDTCRLCLSNYFTNSLNNNYYYSGSRRIVLATLTSGNSKKIVPQLKKIECVSPKKRWKVSVSQVITFLVYATYLLLMKRTPHSFFLFWWYNTSRLHEEQELASHQHIGEVMRALAARHVCDTSCYVLGAVRFGRA